MTSNQDDEKNEIPITMNGIEVMNYLSLDEQKLCFLAKEGYLVPHAGQHPSWFKLLIGSSDELKRRLPNWLYLKSSVESFKLDNKEYLEAEWKQKETDIVEPENIKEYISKCLANNVSKEVIAVELKDKYKLSFLTIGRYLNKEDLNSTQISALKQRGQRLYQKGLRMIAEDKKI